MAGGVRGGGGLRGYSHLVTADDQTPAAYFSAACFNNWRAVTSKKVNKHNFRIAKMKYKFIIICNLQVLFNKLILNTDISVIVR